MTVAASAINDRKCKLRMQNYENLHADPTKSDLASSSLTLCTNDKGV